MKDCANQRRRFLQTAGAACLSGTLGAPGFLQARSAKANGESLDSRISKALSPFIKDNELSGFVAVTGTSKGTDSLVCLGQANLAQGTPMVPQTRFRIASMTKPLTAVTVMMLVQEGKLKPSDLLETHLPEFKGIKVAVKGDGGKIELREPKEPLRVAHLLSHTSGIPVYPKVLGDVYGTRKPDLKGCVTELAKVPLDFDPGSKWSYCNPGIDTLGRLVEVLTGQSFAAFFTSRILEPLEMKSTRFFPTDEDRANAAGIYDRKDGKLVEVTQGWGHPPKDSVHPIPAGGLWSTGPDIAKACVHFLGLARKSLKEGILSPRSFHEMTQIKTGNLKAGFTEGMGFGYGWAVVKQPIGITKVLNPGTFGHGGAFGTQYWIDPVKDRFVILMIQRQGLANGDASPMRKAFQEAVFA